MKDWTNKRVTVLGLGRSGFATAQYLAQRKARVFVSEAGNLTTEKQRQAEALAQLGINCEFGKHSDDALTFAELIVTSPGVKPDSDVMVRASRLGKEVICDIELAYRETQIPIIAVTGTNGKSTTTALISHIFERSGRIAPACGNFGVPILDLVERTENQRSEERRVGRDERSAERATEEEQRNEAWRGAMPNEASIRAERATEEASGALTIDYLIVEVSSYQLMYSSRLAPHVGVLLNLTPDHLDWHGGFENYVAAKRRLFANQSPAQYAVLNIDDPIVAETKVRSQIFPFSLLNSGHNLSQGAFLENNYIKYRIGGQVHSVCRKDELKIIGGHNLENVLAAVSVAALVGISPGEISGHVKTFAALEHRLEYVATINGVGYYNDSKATNPDSVIKALESFPRQKVVLIAGGRDKGTQLGDFVHAVRKHAHAVILLGEAKERFERVLREGGFEEIYKVGTMEEAVEVAMRLKHGPVLLSPACASFDMFRDFEDRGRVFKDIVQTRVAETAPSL